MDSLRLKAINAMATWRRLRTMTALVASLLVWVALGVAAATAMTSATATRVETGGAGGTGWLAGAAAMAVAIAIGGLVLFWAIVQEWRFLKRGYRVRPARRQALPVSSLRSGEWLYEERDHDGRGQSLPFTRIVLAQGYPARSELVFPADEEWDARVPAWARGRRARIIDRVVAAVGGPSFASLKRSENPARD
jgi:hypothetical protein